MQRYLKSPLSAITRSLDTGFGAHCKAQQSGVGRGIIGRGMNAGIIPIPLPILFGILTGASGTRKRTRNHAIENLIFDRMNRIDRIKKQSVSLEGSPTGCHRLSSFPSCSSCKSCLKLWFAGLPPPVSLLTLFQKKSNRHLRFGKPVLY